MAENSVLVPGERIVHHEYGHGVIVEVGLDGYVLAFFGAGERKILAANIQRASSRSDRVLNHVVPAHGARAMRAWLVYEAHALTVMDKTIALTSAKIDLLPHQVVLTHRVATTSPRRFLIADEVGLGKTIEIALILRELESRRELQRSLMIVPAGLVNNWHHELNEIFHLNFEVFGSEGDISDRRSNAFAKHDHLIASVDTLKKSSRVRRLLEAPKWDVVVFDEAHHLSAFRNGGKIRRTENYKLAEALRSHTRDLLLLSATPHQGDHFRFWMLIQLLDPTLFRDPQEMVDFRYRLNAVVVRRSKADVSRPDGTPLFSRRSVHTEAFLMNDEERRFYENLREYLEDGFDLAKDQGRQGRALGFLMAIFQKIAASSFSAARRTLRRRLLMLTIHEAYLHDRDLDIEARERLYDEARSIIHKEFSLGDDLMGRNEVDRLLADLKYRMAKKLDNLSLEHSSVYDSEQGANELEDVAMQMVSLQLPEERSRILQLISLFPARRETKVDKLLVGLGTLWRRNPDEKVVIFATYLGTVDLLAREIEAEYPGQGVVILRGGDSGAKLAAERRFRRLDGPKVLVATAAGREGLNLQFARVLFNFDLPWNPMDIEQRIGRIHRYGQESTAQVYNLVLSDTIEGRIFLMLDDKLTEIAQAIGKVDAAGNVAEDLRSQVLGQLSERLNYDHLYQDAIRDPGLKRTKLELEEALKNAKEAREVVVDLFQDLDGFTMDEYKPFENVTSEMTRLLRFLEVSFRQNGYEVTRVGESVFDVIARAEGPVIRFTTDRDIASHSESTAMLGLDHPMIQQQLRLAQDIPPEDIGLVVNGELGELTVLTMWFVQIGEGSQRTTVAVEVLALKPDGTRMPSVERQCEALFSAPAANPVWSTHDRQTFLREVIEPSLQRDLHYRGLIGTNGSYTAKLIGWIEVL